jgi:CoA binding protein
MDLRRLLRPQSVAVVGASERDSYAGETLLNLRGAEFAGPVWGVNPKRTEAHGYPCFPSLSELPGVPDAVVVAIPAANVPEVVDEAGALGCGGAIVYGAGFGEVATGAEHGCARRRPGTRCPCAGRTGTESWRCTRVPPCGATRCARSCPVPSRSCRRAGTWR